MIGQVQEARYGSRVIAYGANRAGAQALGVSRDHESRQSDRRIEEGIEMIVGKGLVAQCVDQSLTAVIAAENDKVRQSRGPLLAQRSCSEERAYPGSQGGGVDDEDIALLEIALGRRT